jgi:hypothetical protein
VFAYARAEGVELRLDATEIQVRRPSANRGGRRASVSGKKKQNTMKATVIADWQGRTLWTDALRPGRMHDATAARNEGIAICFQHFPDVGVLLDDGYLGLIRDHRGQAITPPRKPRPGALPGRVEQWERDRHGHSSDRITVEHALADHKRWKQLTRWTHRRDRLPDTYRAITGLVSDRTAQTWAVLQRTSTPHPLSRTNSLGGADADSPFTIEHGVDDGVSPLPGLLNVLANDALLDHTRSRHRSG